jgi:hypothetical protein
MTTDMVRVDTERLLIDVSPAEVGTHKMSYNH